MVDAYLATGNYDAALGEVARFRNSTPVHPELPFVEARIRFASGDVDRAAAQLRSALDTVAPQDFQPYQGTPTVVMDIAAAANVAASGMAANAGRPIGFLYFLKYGLAATAVSLLLATGYVIARYA